MTNKEELLQLVEDLPEDRAGELLGLAKDLYSTPDGEPLPAFVGVGESGRRDVSERAEEVLRDGLGR